MDLYMVVEEDREGMFFSEPLFRDTEEEAKLEAARMLAGAHKIGHTVEIYGLRHVGSA